MTTTVATVSDERAPDLTAGITRVLQWLAQDERRRLYGPMSAGSGGCTKYGGMGDSWEPVAPEVGDVLRQRKFIEHVSDHYPLGYYCLTDAGREAVSDNRLNLSAPDVSDLAPDHPWRTGALPSPKR
jgi:hypothetical protein